MKKRPLILVLLCVLACALCIGVCVAVTNAAGKDNAPTDYSSLYEHLASNSAYKEGSYVPTEIVIDDPSLVQVYSCDENAAKLYSVPDEILNGDTSVLLEWFLSRDYVRINVSGMLLSSPRTEPVSFAPYPAYQELIKRPDLASAICDFVYANTDKAYELHDEIVALLEHPEVRSAFDNAAE